MTDPHSRKALDRSMMGAVIWNAAARWGSQIFTWVSTILVARLLRPYDYGLVGMAGVYIGIASLISQVGIPDAVLTLRDLTRRNIAELNSVSLLLGTALVAVSYGLAGPLAHFFSAPPLRAVVIVCSTTYIINAFRVVPGALLQKELRFKLLAGVETFRFFCQMAVTLAMAALVYGYWSLGGGFVAYSGAATVYTLFFRHHAFAAPGFRQLGRELRFSRDVLISNVGWYAYSNADFLVAGRMLGEAALGNYTVAWQISSAPIEKIGNLVTVVTPAFFSAVQDDMARVRRYVLLLTEGLSYATVPASIGIALTADYFVPVVLGPNWLSAIEPLRLLGVFVAFRSLTTLPPKVLTAIAETRFVMWTTLATAVILPISFLVASRWGTTGIALAWLLIFPLAMLPLYQRMFRRSHMSAREYLASVMPAASSSLLMAAAVLGARWAMGERFPTAVRLVILIAVGVLAYSGSLLTFNRKRLQHIWRSVRELRKEAAMAGGAAATSE